MKEKIVKDTIHAIPVERRVATFDLDGTPEIFVINTNPCQTTDQDARKWLIFYEYGLK